MKVLLGKLSISACFILMTSGLLAQDNNAMQLWYNAPASDWMTEALPIGNGYVGAMFFGGIQEEHI